MSLTDYDLGSTAPPDEDCAQVGSFDYELVARDEGRRYIDLIRRTLGKEPEGSRLRVRGNPHDMGTYYTVAFFFDDEKEGHVEYMMRLDRNGPLEWEEGKDGTP